MTKISKEIEHVAGLARIALDPEEKEKLGNELSAILGFVEKLNEVNTDDILPLTGGTDLENELREDRPEKELEEKSGQIMKQVPAKKESWVKVKAIFE